MWLMVLDLYHTSDPCANADRRKAHTDRQRATPRPHKTKERLYPGHGVVRLVGTSV
jgi:hypothetical protein